MTTLRHLDSSLSGSVTNRRRVPQYTPEVLAGLFHNYAMAIGRAMQEREVRPLQADMQFLPPTVNQPKRSNPRSGNEAGSGVSAASGRGFSNESERDRDGQQERRETSRENGPDDGSHSRGTGAALDYSTCCLPGQDQTVRERVG